MIKKSLIHIIRFWNLFIWFVMGIAISFILLFYVVGQFRKTSTFSEFSKMEFVVNGNYSYTSMAKKAEDILATIDNIEAIDLQLSSILRICYGKKMISGTTFPNIYDNEVILPVIYSVNRSLLDTIEIDGIFYRIIGFSHENFIYVNANNLTLDIKITGVTVIFSEILKSEQVTSMKKELSDILTRQYHLNTISTL